MKAKLRFFHVKHARNERSHVCLYMAALDHRLDYICAMEHIFCGARNKPPVTMIIITFVNYLFSLTHLWYSAWFHCLLHTLQVPPLADLTCPLTVQARVWGVAYEIPSDEVEATLSHLDFRERCGYERHSVAFHPQDESSPPHRLTIYVGTEDNPYYTGPTSEEELAAVSGLRGL